MFGSMAFVAGVLILQLPETLNRKLPDTLEEAEQIKGDDCNRRTTWSGFRIRDKFIGDSCKFYVKMYMNFNNIVVVFIDKRFVL